MPPFFFLRAFLSRSNALRSDLGSLRFLRDLLAGDGDDGGDDGGDVVGAAASSFECGVKKSLATLTCRRTIEGALVDSGFDGVITHPSASISVPSNVTQ